MNYTWNYTAVLRYRYNYTSITPFMLQTLIIVPVPYSVVSPLLHTYRISYLSRTGICFVYIPVAYLLPYLSLGWAAPPPCPVF